MSTDENTSKTVKLNVGGKHFEVSRNLIVKDDTDTMLSRLVSDTWLEDPEKEIFIDRDGDIFSYILNYLRQGEIMIPETMSMDQFLKDLDFYGITIIEGSVKKDSEFCNKLLTDVLEKRKQYITAKNELETIEDMIEEQSQYSAIAMLLWGHFCKNANVKHECQLEASYSKDLCGQCYFINKKLIKMNMYDESLLNKYLKKYGLKVTDWGNYPCALKLV